MKELPSRKQNRLADYDYSQDGVYFVTIDVKRMKPILATPSFSKDGSGSVFLLTAIGRDVDVSIRNIPKHYQGVKIENYVIMPDHIHLLLNLHHSNRAISDIVNQLKGTVTKTIKRSIWKKGFHDHVIRNNVDYDIHFEYIVNNPYNWEEKIKKAGGR